MEDDCKAAFDKEGEEDQVNCNVSELKKFRDRWKVELGLQPPSVKQSSTTGTTASTALSLNSAPWKHQGTVRHDAVNANQFAALEDTEGDRENENEDEPGENASTVDDEAHELFLQAVHYEQTGNFFDAIRFYKKALVLVPDIEQRVCKQQQHHQLEKERRSSFSDKIKISNLREQEAGSIPDDDDDIDENVDFVVKFLAEIKHNNWLWFEKAKSDERAHFQHFPEEVVKYILRWIVSTDLDVHSLDTLSNVSKGFYVLCRDEKLWKDVCERVWGHASTKIGCQSDFSSYREMFLTRSRVRFDGCYISKITYIRSGENSFQDATYRPWHIVEYYRYIYFTSHGQFLFLTTSEIPINTIPHLRDPTNQTKFNNILIGHYTLEGHNIHGQCWNPNKIKISNSRNNNNGLGNINYNLVLQVLHLKKKFNNGLRWLEYFVNIENNNHVLKNDFTIEQLKFPNFFYSRVKSFTRGAQSVLV